MKALKIGNRQITTLTDLYLHVLKQQSSGLDAASNNVGHSLTGKQTGFDTLICFEVGIAEKFDIGLEAKDSVAAEMGAIDAQDAARVANPPPPTAISGPLSLNALVD
jgi:hypothetical protein